MGVTNPFTSHPVITARIAATVAEVADGRLLLGIGTGNRREFLEPLGHQLEGGPERCRDAIVVSRQLLAGGTTRHRSEHFVADGVHLSVKPPVSVPLYIAGIAPRILEVAGEQADGVIINFASSSGLSYALAHVARGRAKRTPDAASELDVVAWAVAIITGDKTATYDRVRAFVAHTIAPTLPATLRVMGLTDDQITRIRDTYRAEGPEKAAAFVTDAMVDNWAWIGSPEEIIAKIAPLKELGVKEVAIVPLTRELGEMRSVVQDFAERVAPLLP